MKLRLNIEKDGIADIQKVEKYIPYEEELVRLKEQ